MADFDMQRASVVSFLRQMSAESHKRIMNNNFDPSVEEAQLNRFLTIAYEVGEPFAIAEILASLSTLYYALGRFKDSIEAGEQAAAEAFKSEDLSVQAFAFAPLNNNAETYHDLGDALSALELSSKLLKHTTYADLRPYVSEMHSYLADLGVFHLALEQYDDAEAAFRDVITLTENTGQDYPRAIAVAYRGLSEIFLHRCDYVNAWGNARLAYEIAQRQNDNLLRFHVNCTMAHVAESDPNSRTAPEAFYGATIAAIDLMGTPVLRAVSLLHEARFHDRNRNIMRAKQFAALAANILHKAKVTAFDPELHHLITRQN